MIKKINELLTVLWLNNLQEFFNMVWLETWAKYSFIELNENTCIYTKDWKTVEVENKRIIENIIVAVQIQKKFLWESKKWVVTDVLTNIEYIDWKIKWKSYKSWKTIEIKNPVSVKASDLWFIPRQDPVKLIKDIHESLKFDDEDVIKTISTELALLEKKVVSITFEWDYIVIKTPPITINCVWYNAAPNERIEAWNYILRINLFAPEFNSEVINCILQDAWRDYREHHHHPHHWGWKSLCLSEFWTITWNVWKNKNLTVIYDVMYEWLSTCNTEHWLYDRFAFYNDIQECLQKTQ